MEICDHANKEYSHTLDPWTDGETEDVFVCDCGSRIVVVRETGAISSITTQDGGDDDSDLAPTGGAQL